MKKGGVVLVVLLASILILSFSVSAAVDATTEAQKVQKAYTCLQNKTQGKCSALSTEEKIFSTFSIGQCSSELLSASQNAGTCWSATGGSSCKIKTTAQAVLALNNKGSSTEKAQDWLLNQNKTPSELSWYLEIETQNSASCVINYSSSSHTVSIGDDKKISGSAGSCLSLSTDGYWLRVAPSCYGQNIQVSCNQGFLTTLLFQKTGSSTVHVSTDTSSASANGVTVEKVKSTCFSENGVCTYEGTLWATLVLNSLGKDVSSNLPYLITLAEDNRRYLPNSFLYMITGDQEYRNDLLSEQKSSKWWLESGDKFFDTALALYPFQQESLQEKTNAKEWLLETQDSNGCWESNVRNTGFVLASIWPNGATGSSNNPSGLPNCETAGNFCTTTGNCQGQILNEFSCSSLFVCCTVKPEPQTCFELGGSVCTTGQTCSGEFVSATDLISGQRCCVSGFCQVASEELPTPTGDSCESSGGTCSSFGCNSDESENSASCTFSGDVCCVKSFSSGGSSKAWVWILLVLIVLVVLGIIFRNHLRHFIFRIKDGLGKKNKPGSGSSSGFMQQPFMRPFPTERRILSPQPFSRPRPSASVPSRPGKSRAQKELDDVLKKLKDMSS